eukprot:gene33386-41199_t
MTGKTVDSTDNSPSVFEEPLNLQLDVDSPRSMESNESVLTVISPTKEKRLFSPTKRSRSASGGISVVSPAAQKSPRPTLEVTIGKLDNSTCTTLDACVLEDIYSCVVRGDIDELKGIVLKFGVDLATIQLQALHYSPLHVAVIHDQPAMASYLLEQGVDIHLTDKDGQTATYLAYTLNRYDLAALLVSHRAGEFTSSPFSPYGSHGTSLNDGGSVRSRFSGSSRYEDLNSTFSGGVITLSRDNSFRSNHSVDFPIQQMTSSNKSEQPRVRPSSFNFTSGAPLLQRARTDPVRTTRSVSFSDDHVLRDNNFHSTVSNGSVMGTIHTSLSFDEKEEGEETGLMHSTTKSAQQLSQLPPPQQTFEALRFGFQSPAHIVKLQDRLDELCRPVSVSRASNKECDKRVDNLNRAWHMPFAIEDGEEPMSTVNSVSSSVHDQQDMTSVSEETTST